MADHDTNHGPCSCGAWHDGERFPKGPTRSPFPPEVVERIKSRIPPGFIGHKSFVEGKQLALSVIADYLRSEEARGQAATAARDAYFSCVRESGDGAIEIDWVCVADAVISALLGEKEQR